MRVRRSVGLSWQALLTHKVRAILAVCSVSVGVAAVLLTSAIGAGARREVSRRIDGLGTNLLIVRPAQVQPLAARKAIRGTVRTLHFDDYVAIADDRLVAAAAPSLDGGMRVKAGTTATLTTVRGTTPAYRVVRRFQLAAGRFVDEEDDRQARRVAVLGARVRAALFGDANPLGREIRVRGVPFDVIGVLAPKGALADGSDEDNQVVVPFRTALRRILNATWLTAVFVSVTDAGRMMDAERRIRDLVRARHRPLHGSGPDDFEVQNSTKSLAVQRQAVESLTGLTTGLGAIALVVGGFGILGLMLLSVKERTGEIGLRMAVGARPRDVFAQFVFEAILLALAGWGAGFVVGAALAALVALATTWPVGVPTGAVVASAAMALVIGVGFGAWPARRASLIPPIEALLAE
jgi:putative ABC transport system permease protein